ncbi:DUF308 domain-containing protein [Tabrizicola sp.]|jgi:uncharacterized membrane protein HdeD (DUF308 family)|uniref:HdeD family acid-resistance protein n=1 Tax=Tabrizicola sp. TaxID=2005166 RepID=UPI001A5C60BC|nr:DUF308 domain-containing protein [Tabrizicola sp.]MBL9073795.1 DUF308 domain-containing protein [Tabrizicola sp.]
MKNRSLLIILGIVTVIAGFFAILNPVAGSIAVTLLTGWFFLLIGILQAVAVFRETDWSHRLWSLLLAILAILAGIGLLTDPLAGVISLTYLLAILFVVSGVFKIIASFAMEAGNWKWIVLLSGVLSLGLGILIFANFAQAALTTLGLLLGLQLISDGASMLGLALASHRLDRV